MNKLRFVLFR